MPSCLITIKLLFLKKYLFAQHIFLIRYYFVMWNYKEHGLYVNEKLTAECMVTSCIIHLLSVCVKMSIELKISGQNMHKRQGHC